MIAVLSAVERKTAVSGIELT